MMNILDDQLAFYKSLPVKNSKEVQFSNGGHLFACQSGKYVWIYNFYTAEMVMELRGHNHYVR
jgi:hypothetical protein